MRSIGLSLLCLFSLTVSAQTKEAAVKKTIEKFFEGFHQQDSLIMKQTVGANPVLQTIGKNKEGQQILRTETFDKLIASIVSIPDSVRFEEKLMSFNIQVDGAMANAWTPYEFWLNGSFHHCGVNSFQLFHDGSDWKIIYLIDTRRRENCQ